MKEINPLDIIEKYYDKSSKAYSLLVPHSISVANKAVEIAEKHPEWKPDVRFIYEAAMLHDLGVDACDAPGIGCHGDLDYIYHGYVGAERLRALGLPQHALVCERHVGTGISLEQIIERGWDLPHRDMIPLSLEEIIVCYADKFYSKTGDGLEKSPDKILKGLKHHGEDEVQRFLTWHRLFG